MLCSFLVSIHELMFFRGLIWTTYLSFPFILQTNLLHFFFLDDRNGKLLRNFFGYATSTSRIYPLFKNYHYQHNSFNELFIKFINIFLSNLKPFTGSFWDIRHPYKLFPSKYMLIIVIIVWSFNVFLIISFYVLIICFCISMHCMTHSIPSSFFNHP